MTCTPRGLTLGASKIILIIPSVSPMIWPRPGLPYLSLPTTEQARVAVCHAFGFEYKKETDRFRPTYLFSIPEPPGSASTEEQARKSAFIFARRPPMIA